MNVEGVKGNKGRLPKRIDIKILKRITAGLSAQGKSPSGKDSVLEEEESLAVG